MKASLLLPLVVCSCQTARTVTMPNGATYSDGGHFAGDTTVMMEPDGTVILRNKMNAPWRDFLQAAVAVFFADRAAEVAVAQIAKNRATSVAAQRAAAARAGTNLELEKLRIAADLEKFRILNPLPETLPAGVP
jgi:hypothetical protein